MRALLITITLLISSFATYSQNSYKLNQKNGFNIFILGSSIQENKNLVKLSKVKMNGKSDVLKNYEVKNINDIKLFDYDITSIYLLFYKDSLLHIEVNFKSWEFGNNDQSSFIQEDIADKIAKEYGQWNWQDLVLSDEIDKIQSKQYINSTKVCLWRYHYKSNEVSPFRYVFRGDRYLFVSNEIYRKMNAEKGNPSGL